MRLLAFLSNWFVLGCIIWSFVNVGVPDFKDEIWILFIPAILASVSNLIYYFFPASS